MVPVLLFGTFLCVIRETFCSRAKKKACIGVWHEGCSGVGFRVSIKKTETHNFIIIICDEGTGLKRAD